jgi:hypothetical protein
VEFVKPDAAIVGEEPYQMQYSFDAESFLDL